MIKTHTTKATVVGESNKAGVWGLLLEAIGSSGAEPPTLQRFYSFFFKNAHF